MIRMRSGKGLGDSLYLQSIARHWVEEGKNLEVCTLWPDVFRPLQGKIRISHFRRHQIDLSAHYIWRKTALETDQFTDCCLACGITEKIELRLDWKPSKTNLIDRVRASGKPVIIVQLPRQPFDRADRFGEDLLPDCRTIQRAIDMLKGRAFIVQVGAAKRPLYEFRGLDLDLANKTSVAELIDVASVASGGLGYCSFLAPLTESFDTPALFVWSKRGLRSRNEFIRQIVPQKIFNKPSSRAVNDDCSEAELARAVDTLLEQIGSRAKV